MSDNAWRILTVNGSFGSVKIWSTKWRKTETISEEEALTRLIPLSSYGIYDPEIQPDSNEEITVELKISGRGVTVTT